MFRRSIDDTHDLRARKMRTTLAVLDKKGDEALNTAFGVIQSLVLFGFGQEYAHFVIITIL